jgi:hypothetical protein
MEQPEMNNFLVMFCLIVGTAALMLDLLAVLWIRRT